MKELSGEIEPLLTQLDECVMNYIEMLQGEESDQDEEIESWEMQAELVRSGSNAWISSACHWRFWKRQARWCRW